MADFSSLKQTIQTYIKQNGNEEITGNILQDVLLAMVSTMGDGAINSLASALQDEITARQNQDATLQGNIAAEGTARQQADTALGGRIDGLQTAVNGINTKLAEGYIYAGIATPSTNPGTPSGKVFYIAVSSGTYTNFSNLTAAQGINILKYNGSAWSKDDVYAIDARPKKNSQNFVTSGGVFDNMGALDVSELNATENPHTLAQYADLSAALAAIPTDYQKGGMSIKFEQTSDNKYVQYLLVADDWNPNVSDWKKQGADLQNNIGYFVCDTASSSQVKSITAPLYQHIIGSSIKIKFLHHSETAIAYFNINGTEVTEIYYNGKAVGWGNSWKDNEIVEMYYDGSVYQCWPIIQNEIFDISAFNNGATYVNLEKALAAIPSYLVYDVKIVKFIQEFATGNQYVQYTLNNPSGFTRDYTKWQGNQFILIKNTDFVNPGTLQPNGTIGVSGDVYYYAKKQIKGGSKIFVSAKTAPSICTIQFKDSNGDVISDSNVVGNYEVQSLFVTAPSNAVWVYIGNTMYGASAYSDAYYIIDFLDDVVSYDNINPVSSGGVYNSIQDYAQKKNDFVNDGGVRNTGSITSGAGVYYYAKRTIKSGDRIYAKVNTAESICAVAFFDSNNTIISGSSIMGTYENQEINTIAPPNSAFVYISSRKPYLNDSFYIINYTNVNDITSVMSFSKRCFDFGKKAPKKPCVTITFDVLKDFSFGSQKGLFDYIDLLRRYGINASSFFIRPTAGQIDNVADFVKANEIGQDICIHSIHTDSFGENDTENPHPSLSVAETKLQNYQKWFKTYSFPYSMGWVTSRGALYSSYLPLLKKYLSYGHTSNNLSYDGSWPDADGINQRTDDKMDIIRVGLDLDSSATSTDEQNLVSRIETLIDETIASNGFLCLYGHGFDNLEATYTMRESVLTTILTYLKTKIDNFEILVGSEAEIVPYFYD